MDFFEKNKSIGNEKTENPLENEKKSNGFFRRKRSKHTLKYFSGKFLYHQKSARLHCSLYIYYSIWKVRTTYINGFFTYIKLKKESINISQTYFRNEITFIITLRFKQAVAPTSLNTSQPIDSASQKPSIQRSACAIK